MRALVVYESLFGNTQRVAETIATGLRDEAYIVDCVEVSRAPNDLPSDIALLVVGGPTHAFSMTSASTRDSAAKQSQGESLVSTGIGLREWIGALHTVNRPPVAVFDTRIRKAMLPGSAAKAAAKRLRKLGFTLTVPPESFWVTGTTGPLTAGEDEHARRWGRDVAEVAVHPSSH